MAGDKAPRSGSLDEVLKTSIRMPRRLLKHVDALGDKLGLPNQTIYTLGTIRMLLELAPLIEAGKKRRQMVEDLEAYMEKSFAKYKEGLE